MLPEHALTLKDRPPHPCPTAVKPLVPGVFPTCVGMNRKQTKSADEPPISFAARSALFAVQEDSFWSTAAGLAKVPRSITVNSDGSVDFNNLDGLVLDVINGF